MNPGQFISSKEIAARQNIPANFLPQIIALLGTKGWVEGVRGPGGGVRLVADPQSISVLEIVEVIEGPVALTRCLGGEDSCMNREVCPLHEVWSEAQAAMLNVLTSTTLSDLVKRKMAVGNDQSGKPNN